MFHQLIRPSLLLALILGVSAPVHAASLLQKSVTDQYSEVLSSFSKAKSEDERKAIYEAFAKRVETDVQRMPADFPESEVDTAAAYIELHAYLKEVPVGGLTVQSCPKTPQKILRLSNPQALEESEGSEVGQFLIKIVKTVCQR